jgi:hypothetical protein
MAAQAHTIHGRTRARGDATRSGSDGTPGRTISVAMYQRTLPAADPDCDHFPEVAWDTAPARTAERVRPFADHSSIDKAPASSGILSCPAPARITL